MVEIKNNKIAPLYYDRVFKIVFSREKKILIRFLNNILWTNYSEDVQVSFERSLLSRDKNGKEFRQDVVIVINEKEYICIELNRRADAYSLNRNLIYIMDLMILGLNKGDGSDIIDNRSVKLINLNNFSNKGGIDEGKEEGLQEWIEKGINEEKLSMIKNMLKKKLDYTIIADV